MLVIDRADDGRRIALRARFDRSPITTLRRLNKKVEWVSYTNGCHGMPTTTVEEVRDYHKRIITWYDSHQ